MNKILCLLVCAWLPASAGLAQQADPLRQRMGEAQFHAAGLDRLSPAELATLERWLAAHGGELVDVVPVSQLPSARAAAQAAERPAAPAAARQDTISSRIAGRFTGWHAGDVLTLANGQRWRVVDDSSLVTGRPLEAPAVTVKHGLFGGWLLKVEGYNTSARVAPAD